MQLWVKVLKPFGYYDDHNAGEELKVSLLHINNLVRNGFVEIMVNNHGNNLPYDEKATWQELFEEIGDHVGILEANEVQVRYAKKGNLVQVEKSSTTG